GAAKRTPCSLWTASRGDLLSVTVATETRESRNPIAHAKALGDARQRPSERRRIGAAFDDPPIDHAGLARSMGMWATGPISHPNQIAPAFEAALAEIDAGRPALVQVHTPQG